MSEAYWKARAERTDSNTTCTRCQNCGEWTNYAGDPHHMARMARLARLARLESVVLSLCEQWRRDGHTEAAEALQDAIDTPVIGKASVDEATQEERDRLRRRATIHAVLATRMGRQHTSTSVQPELLLGLLNDAERLAELEQGVRELSSLWESQQAEYPNTDAGRVSAAAVLCCAAELCALLNPSVSREADEESGDDHE